MFFPLYQLIHTLIVSHINVFSSLVNINMEPESGATEQPLYTKTIHVDNELRVSAKHLLVIH